MAKQQTPRALLLSCLGNLSTKGLFHYSVNNCIQLEGISTSCFDREKLKRVSLNQYTCVLIENITINDIKITLVSNQLNQTQYNEYRNHNKAK
jgi:hypothetical protein